MKKIIFATVFSLFASGVFAQHTRHEFSVVAGGGLSALNYELPEGNRTLGLGGRAGVGYGYFWSPAWGLRSGLELGLFNSRADMSGFHDRFPAVDMDGTTFEFRTTLSNHRECQRAMMLQIPLMLQFQTRGQNQFYAAAGGRVGFPLRACYRTSATVVNSGYYAQEHYEYTNRPFAGFGRFENQTSEGSLNLRTAFFASAELGMKWRLNSRMSLYTGIFADYGLNNINSTSVVAQHPLIAYNAANPTAFPPNSVLNSQRNNRALTDKITPLSAGISLRLAFGRSCNRRTAEEIIAEEIMSVCAVEEQRRLVEKERNRFAEEQRRLMREQARLVAEQSRLEEEQRRLEAERVAAIETIQEPVEGFRLSQTTLTAAQKQELDKRIALLKQYPDLEVFIYGHTCNIGSRQANETVGLRRAENAKAYLISQGIDANRIIGTASKRDTEPLVPNVNETNRRENRRVEIVVR